jgi:hypothetical protein
VSEGLVLALRELVELLRPGSAEAAGVASIHATVLPIRQASQEAFG